MPYTGYRPRPIAGSNQVIRSSAPLTTESELPPDLPRMPADEVDVPDDLDLPKQPVRKDRPDVPFAAPRRRVGTKPSSLMPTISVKRYTVSPDQIQDTLFPARS